MPRGNFTKEWITVNCGFCSKQMRFPKGQYEQRIKRTKAGLLFCSDKCRTDYRAAKDMREQKLICKRCGKDFTNDLNKYGYRKRVKQIESGVDIFCSNNCHVIYMDQDPEKIRIISEKQRGVSAPQRGRVGHPVDEETRNKIAESHRLYQKENTLVIETQCVQCDKDIIRPKWYQDSLDKKNKGRGPFCSRRCALIGRPVSVETREKIAQPQIRISRLQSGRVGHTVSQETKTKLSLVKTGVPIKVDWDVVSSECDRRGWKKYAIMRAPIPDAVTMEDGKLVALELQKGTWEANVRRKMREYQDYHTKWDKVYLVWYTPDNIRRGEWILENGIWTMVN